MGTMVSEYSHEVFMARLVALPVELLLTILTGLSNGHLKVLSLKCKKLASIAQELLFHTLTVAPRKRELRALKHVANHPVLGLHVKHLSYDLSSYLFCPGIGTIDTYTPPLRADSLRPSPDVHKYSEHEFLRSYLHTKNLIKDEMAILKKNLIPEVLSKTLPSFKKLEQVSCSYRYTGRSRFQGAPPQAPRPPARAGDYQGSKDIVDTAMRTMMRTTNKVKAPLTTFYLHLTPLCLRKGFPLLSSKRSQIAALKFFSNLITIHMRLGCHPWTIDEEARGVPYVPHGQVASVTDIVLVDSQLLQNAKKLKNLSFGYAKVPSQRNVILHFPLFLQFGDNFRWTELRSLELENMFLYAEEFVSFVNLHADTLKEVTLTNMVFSSAEEWHEAISCIKNASLRHIEVRITTPLKIFIDGEVSIFQGTTRVDDLVAEKILAKKLEISALESSKDTIICNRRVPS